MILIAPGGEVRLTLAAIGDVAVLARSRSRSRRDGIDSVLAAFTPALRAADVAFANLEFPLGEPAWVRPGRSAEFWHDDEVPAALARAGVRLVSLANNHMMDCGERGLERTIEACRAAGLETAGAGADLESALRPARIEVRGLRIAVLAAATPSDHTAAAGHAGTAPLEWQALAGAIARCRESAEIVIVSAHWGSMYVDYPPPRVLELADRLVELGVDAVLGHHPHVMQGARRMGHTMVAFSLGDAVFDPAAGDFEASIASDVRGDTGVFTLDLAPQPGLRFDPCRLDAEGVPRGASPAEAEEIVARLRRLSAGLEGGAEKFRSESAPQLLRYELESLGAHLRAGRIGRAARLLLSLRPRHLPLLWNAMIRGRAAARRSRPSSTSDGRKH